MSLTYLKDYQTTAYIPENLNLNFEILDNYVQVSSITNYNLNSTDKAPRLILSGSAKLIACKLNGNEINPTITDNTILLTNLPTKFSLEIITQVDAFNDKSCMGLYASGNNLITQCEAEGFRKITYFQDRPDVMTKYTVTIIADKTKYPILLSNGNLIEQKELTHNRHQVTWQDPFGKPSYLFALVAGQFNKISDYFITKSGKKVLLEIYTAEQFIEQTHFAMQALKKAFLWEEERFNLEYDLERFMIVATPDFNMGAMENKGLNIFNTKYILADSQTATDTDFINIDAVVGHEYFHNWTGNRVTLRDWFQLSLKEGLTVFRDQEFIADLYSPITKRIRDVNLLKQSQFSEDSSSLAHPVRPESYLEINNFYTATVYEKGAEIVRMYHTILGREKFTQALNFYLQQNDGKAATCEDFLTAMNNYSPIDLTQFMLWYTQAGTPHIKLSTSYQTGIYKIKLQQKNSLSLPANTPLLIPLAINFIDKNGPINYLAENQANIIVTNKQTVLILSQAEQTFNFKLLEATEPIISINQNFSAPVIIEYDYNLNELLNLLLHDQDGFNQNEAMQNIYKKLINLVYNEQAIEKIVNQLIPVLTKLLLNSDLDPELKSLLLQAPEYTELIAYYQDLNPIKLVGAIAQVKLNLAKVLNPLLEKIYLQLDLTNYRLADLGLRALKNKALEFLLLEDEKYILYAKNQYQNANNMTDKFAVLKALNNLNNSIKIQIFDNFAIQYANNPLVMDKWFYIQSLSHAPDTLNKIHELYTHKNFDKYNPNKLYSLVRSFTINALYFNTLEGYRFVTQEILRVDSFNPSVASRIAHSFSQLTNFSQEYKELAKPYLKGVLETKPLSKDVYELISKTYASLYPKEMELL